MWYSGMRGALSFALVVTLNGGRNFSVDDPLSHDSFLQLVGATLMTICVTTLFLAPGTRPLIRALRIGAVATLGEHTDSHSHIPHHPVGCGGNAGPDGGSGSTPTKPLVGGSPRGSGRASPRASLTTLLRDPAALLEDAAFPSTLSAASRGDEDESPPIMRRGPAAGTGAYVPPMPPLAPSAAGVSRRRTAEEELSTDDESVSRTPPMRRPQPESPGVQSLYQRFRRFEAARLKPIFGGRPTPPVAPGRRLLR